MLPTAASVFAQPKSDAVSTETLLSRAKAKLIPVILILIVKQLPRRHADHPAARPLSLIARKPSDRAKPRSRLPMRILGIRSSVSRECKPRAKPEAARTSSGQLSARLTAQHQHGRLVVKLEYDLPSLPHLFASRPEHNKTGVSACEQVVRWAMSWAVLAESNGSWVNT